MPSPVGNSASVEKITPSSEGYVCELDGGQTVLARAVVLATGVDWRRLQAKDEDRLLGRGIFYGAARQEATNVVGRRSSSWEAEIPRGKLPCYLQSYFLGPADYPITKFGDVDGGGVTRYRDR